MIEINFDIPDVDLDLNFDFDKEEKLTVQNKVDDKVVNKVENKSENEDAQNDEDKHDDRNEGELLGLKNKNIDQIPNIKRQRANSDPSKPSPLIRGEFKSKSQRRWYSEMINFDAKRLPSQNQLLDISQLTVFDEFGLPRRFGHLYERKKTIVIFLRHSYCPNCQDYSRNEINQVRILPKKYRLIVITPSSWRVIKSYRSLLGVPCQMYSDPHRQLYKVLGMSFKTMYGGEEKNYVTSSKLKQIKVS